MDVEERHEHSTPGLPSHNSADEEGSRILTPEEIGGRDRLPELLSPEPITADWHPAWGVLRYQPVRRQLSVTLAMGLLVIMMYTQSRAVLVFIFTLLFSTATFICLRIALERRAAAGSMRSSLVRFV
eukprot:gb/GEZN01024531.1/.p1 GENE.gb/GEZN01024531.1/~~gb/GEZN01024531.1/.p1  ORF type:complete len:127 (-),score=11.27 gb/GEZN01024531.1/:139-519(-)